jgi:hypothetical protein
MERRRPPPDIADAALQVLYLAAFTTRNWTLNDEVSRRQVNALWEAPHEVPALLTRWPGDEAGLEQLRRYCAEYDWLFPEPNLTARFEQALAEAHARA